MRLHFQLLILLLVSSFPGYPVRADEVRITNVPLREASAATFYVTVDIDGLGPRDYLVDTGAGYMTIDEEVLTILKTQRQAIYVKDLVGILADNSQLVVPVYRIPGITIGESCRIEHVDVAVIPGGGRGILGLSVLRRIAPFTIFVEPPALHLSNCDTQA